MEPDSVPPRSGSPLVRLQAGKFQSGFGTPPFKLDEGYSDETKSQGEVDGGQEMLALPEWLLAHNEADRAGMRPQSDSLVAGISPFDVN